MVLTLAIILSADVVSPTEQPIAFDIAHHMRTWSSIAFYLAMSINFLVALFYPFDKGSDYVGKPPSYPTVEPPPNVHT